MWFKTNDLLECVTKLTKFHKTQVGEKWEILANDQAWRGIEDQDTRPCIDKLFFLVLYLNLYIVTKKKIVDFLLKVTELVTKGNKIVDFLGFNLNHSYFEVNKHVI